MESSKTILLFAIAEQEFFVYSRKHKGVVRCSSADFECQFHVIWLSRGIKKAFRRHKAARISRPSTPTKLRLVICESS